MCTNDFLSRRSEHGFIINVITNFFAGFQIEHPEDFKLHILRLFRLVRHYPTLMYFTIFEFSTGQLDEAIFTLLILIAFFLPTRFDQIPQNKKFNIRVVMILMVTNFIYIIFTRPDTYITEPLDVPRSPTGGFTAGRGRRHILDRPRRNWFQPWPFNSCFPSLQFQILCVPL